MLYYSPKANQATKAALPLDDKDLATHLLRMCTARWQTQYNLTKNATPVSTMALLLVLENIENNADLIISPGTQTSQKGLKGNARWTQSTPGFQRSPRRWAGLTSIVYYA